MFALESVIILTFNDILTSFLIIPSPSKAIKALKPKGLLSVKEYDERKILLRRENNKRIRIKGTEDNH